MANKTTLRREVLKADPNWLKDKRKEVEYQFTNRTFERNPDQSEIYTGDD